MRRNQQATRMAEIKKKDISLEDVIETQEQLVENLNES